MLTVYGIETQLVLNLHLFSIWKLAATVLTACGIETFLASCSIFASILMLQQYLPFTVLKLYKLTAIIGELFIEVATVLTAYGIE